MINFSFKNIFNEKHKRVWSYSAITAFFLFMFMCAEAPFQEPDSFNHFYRSYQIATGHLIGTKYSEDFSGGRVPEINHAFFSDTMKSAFDRNNKIIRTNYKYIFCDRILENIKDVPFPNTVVYFPISYTPQSISIVISNYFNLTIFQSFYLMRFFVIVFSLSILSLSVFICPTSCRFIMFFVLGIPEVNIICSSISFDAMVLCEAVLSSAIICRAINEKNEKDKTTLVFLFSLISSFLVTSKPPYFAILLIPLFINGILQIKWYKIFSIFVVSISVPLFWILIGVNPIITRANSYADAHKQINNLLCHPFYIFHVIWNSIRFDSVKLIKQSVGTIRWTGPWLPNSYCFFIVIIFSIITALWFISSRRSPRILKTGIVTLFFMLVSAFFIAFSIYLSWTPVAGQTFWGLNGRYFTVLLMFLPVAFAETNISPKYISRIERILLYGFYPFSALIALRTMLLINWG